MGIHKFLAVPVAAFFVLALGVASQPASAQDQALAATSVLISIQKKGVFRVGLATFVPWAMRARDGSMVGYEVDVATQLAKDMGVKLELVPTAWAGIIPALLAGKFDTIIGGMTATPSRNLTVNFSIPYEKNATGFVANKKLAGNFKTVEDFNQPGVTLTTRRGSANVKRLQAMFPKATLRLFDEEVTCAQEVINGNVHAWQAAMPSPLRWSLDNPDELFLPFGSPAMNPATNRALNNSVAGFAVRKGDPDVLNYFDTWITGRTNSGWLDDRHDYWFGTNEWYDLVPESISKLKKS